MGACSNHMLLPVCQWDAQTREMGSRLCICLPAVLFTTEVSKARSCTQPGGSSEILELTESCIHIHQRFFLSHNLNTPCHVCDGIGLLQVLILRLTSQCLRSPSRTTSRMTAGTSTCRTRITRSCSLPFSRVCWSPVEVK